MSNERKFRGYCRSSNRPALGAKPGDRYAYCMFCRKPRSLTKRGTFRSHEKIEKRPESWLQFRTRLDKMVDERQIEHRKTAHKGDPLTCPECLSYLIEALRRQGDPSTYYCRYAELHADEEPHYFTIERGIIRRVRVVYEQPMIGESDYEA